MTVHTLLAADHSNALHAPLARALRAATREIHGRLHHHPGFNGDSRWIDRSVCYRHLLSRMYGFHAAFEQTAQIAPARSRGLALDLASLGMCTEAVELIALCPTMLSLDTVERRLGASYVIEGSMLGGRALARRLDRLCGIGATSGRRFFLARGSGTGATWNSYIGSRDAHPLPPQGRAAAVDAAIDIFRLFADWLSDWSTTSNE